MPKKLVAAALILCGLVAPAHAEMPAQNFDPHAPVQAQPAPQAAAPGGMMYARNDGAVWWKQPDLIGFSAGYYDVNRNNPRNPAADFRVEHRWGVSLLPKVSSFFDSWEPYVQFRPLAGLEGTSDGALYGYGGFVMDIFIGENFFLSPNEAVGVYYRGNGKRLGSFVEFRSTMEAGYRFDNNMRVSVSYGHISNAGLTKLNPGTEILSGNVYIPVGWIFGD